MNEANIDRVPHGVLIKIRALYDTLKSAERKLVDYLLENPADVEDSTIVEMAGRAGCSEATIVRLSKKLGFEGFPRAENGLWHRGWAVEEVRVRGHRRHRRLRHGGEEGLRRDAGRPERYLRPRRPSRTIRACSGRAPRGFPDRVRRVSVMPGSWPWRPARGFSASG